MAKSNVQAIIEKAVQALVSSIEVYNKPDFKYREENFSILLVNAWELLLKAKIITDNNGNRRSIYIKYFPENKDGRKSKKHKYKTTDSGNYLTLDIKDCIKQLRSNNTLQDNIALNILSFIEIRNTSIHYHNTSIDYIKSTHELGSASIHGFITYLYEWFGHRLTKYNLYLLPLSFFGSQSTEAIPVYSQEQKLLDYIDQQRSKHPYKKMDKYHYSFQIQISFTKKNKSGSGVYLSNDASAPKVQLSDEDLKERYPLRFTDLVDKCKARYENFVQNSKFFKSKEKLENDLKYCYLRYPGLDGSGTPVKHYSSAILEELDKAYKLKKEK